MRYTTALLFIIGGCFSMNNAVAQQTVVLLHGLARSAHSMNKMNTALQQAGFRTCNIDYPSTKYPIEVLADRFVLPQIQACAKGAPVSFVTHSMGGILVRQLRKSHPELAFGRVVMLGPPNQGSEIVDHIRDWSLFRWVNGPAGQQLSTAPSSLPNTLGVANFEVGIIAGNKPLLEPFKGYIAGQSDGKVSVASTHLNGMKDAVVLPVTHALMMRDPQVIAQTIQFLKIGQFDYVVRVKNSFLQ